VPFALERADLSTLIRQGPLAYDEHEFSAKVRSLFPWLKHNFACIVWIQPIVPPHTVVSGVEWIPAIVDTGYNGTVAMRLEHFADINGGLLLEDEDLSVFPGEARATERGLLARLPLNVRLSANIPKKRARDPNGRTEILPLSDGIELFLPGDLDEASNDVVWWQRHPNGTGDYPRYDVPDRRCRVPLLGLRALVAGGLSFLLNINPPHNSFSIADRPW
jgi:hypothetical protein